MSWMQTITVFPKAPDSRPVRQVEQEIIDELQFHIEMRTADNVSSGMSALEARQDALKRFGDFQRIQKACRRTLLGERIMLQRIQTVMTLVLLGAVIYMAVQFYRGQRANEAATALMMERLETIVSNEPPVVVETSPQNGKTDVDPSLKEIRVTYNKKMADESWSWTQVSAETFPETTGDARYEADGKTCVLPVKLKPGKEYVILLNSDNYGNFKDISGHSAVPYYLSFKTRR